MAPRYIYAALIAAAVIAYTAFYTINGSIHNNNCVKLGIEFNTHATAAWLALYKHMFEKYGICVSNIYKFRTGLELAAAMTHGDVEVAWACIAPVLKMIANRGLDVVVVAGAHFYGYGCVGRPGIDSLGDLLRLKHPRIAVTGKGTQTHVLLLAAMKKWHFNATIVFSKPPAILSLVEKGDVDAACLPEHYLSIAEAHGLHVLFIAQQVWPYMPGSYLVALRSFAEKHPDIICRLWRLDRDATKMISENRTLAAIVDAKYLGIPVKVAERSISRLYFTWRVNVTAIQQLADFMYKEGLLKRPINVSKIVIDVTKLCGGGAG